MVEDYKLVSCVWRFGAVVSYYSQIIKFLAPLQADNFLHYMKDGRLLKKDSPS